LESLSLLVALMMVSFWLLAGSAMFLSLIGLRLVGCTMGIFSVIVSVWLLFAIPHVPLIGLINIAFRRVEVNRYFKQKGSK